MGYIIFGSSIDADILKNYQVSGSPISSVMDAVRVGFGLSFTLSYPVVLFEARHNLDMLIFSDDGVHRYVVPPPAPLVSSSFAITFLILMSLAHLHSLCIFCAFPSSAPTRSSATSAGTSAS